MAPVNRWYFCFQLLFFVLLAFSYIQESSAQVGGIPACTNFTCRYGECEQLQTTFQCHCPAGVKGTNCDRAMQPGDDMCLSNPCWNSGTCINLGNDFRCLCPEGKTGKNCRTIDSAPCLVDNPCRNNAVCRVVATSVTGFYCFCVGFWTGQFCETAIPLCSRPTPCYNGGLCRDDLCECQKNFTGYQCETYSPPSTDKVVTILNKGWYVASMRLSYEQQIGFEKIPIDQTGSIALNQNYAFYIPNAVNLDGAYGVTLTIDAVLGVRVLNVRITSNPQCIHIWGTTLFPSWSFVEC